MTMRTRHGATPTQRPPTMFEATAADHKISALKQTTLPRGRNLTDPDLLLHMQSPSCSTPSSIVRPAVPLRPRIETSDFALPLIPTIRADSPMSTHSRDPRMADDLEPPRLWKTTSRGSQPNSPSVTSACPSPTPSATPSAYSVRLKTSSGGGEASGSRLQRKKSNASLLVKRGLTRMGSVMSRKGASAGGREGSRHGQQSSTSTPPRRRLPRNNSLTLDDLVEESHATSSPGLMRVQSPLQPLLPSQICQGKDETGGVSRPFNVQHQLHVTENLEGLPMEWLDQLKAQGMSESELLLIVAAHKKQRSIALHPINPTGRRKPLPNFTVGDVSAPTLSRSQRNPSGALDDAQDDVNVILRTPKKHGRPSHDNSEPTEARKMPKEKPSLTIQVPPRERTKVQLEQGHISPPSQRTYGVSLAPVASSLTAVGSTLTWPRAASSAAPALPNVPIVTAAPTPVSPPKTGPDPFPQPLEAAARSPTSASLPPTPTSASASSKVGRRSRALSTQLRRSSSIITKLLTEFDPASSRPSRSSGQHLQPLSRADNGSGSDTEEKRKGEHERGPSNVSAISFLTVGSVSSAGRRMSDEIRGFQNLNIDLTDGDEWAASILAAWDEEGGMEEPPEGIQTAEVAPAPLQDEGTDAPEADYVPEEAEIRVVRPPITKQASMISLRAVMEEAAERKERPRPKSVSLDRVYSPPPPPRPLRVASPVNNATPPSEPRLVVPTMSSSRLRCVSVDSFGVQRRHSQTPTTSPSSSEIDLSTPPLDETATAVISLPKPMTQPLRINSPRASPTPPLRILRSPKSASMNRSSSGQSLNVSAYRSRPSSQASKRDVHLSPSALSLNHARLSLQAKSVGSIDSPSLYSPRSSRHYSPIRSSYSSHRASLPRPPPSRPPPDVPRSNTETTEGTSSTTPGAQAFPSTGSFLPFSEEEAHSMHSPAEVSASEHRREAFSLPTSADSLPLEYTQDQREQNHVRGQESIQSMESLFASSGALGLVLNLDGVNNRLSEGAALSRVSSCSSANYSYQLHEATVQRAYTRVLRRAGESVHDLGGDVDEVSSESAYGDDAYIPQDTLIAPGYRPTPSGPTGVTPVDVSFANARLIRVNELEDPEDGYHTAYASPRFDTNRMSMVSGYSSVYHSVSSATDPDFQSAGQATHLPFPFPSHVNHPSPLGQLPPQPQHV